jgi:hypothetical protein
MVGILFGFCSGDGMKGGWVYDEMGFAFENGKLCSMGSGGLEWRKRTVLR